MKYHIQKTTEGLPTELEYIFDMDFIRSILKIHREVLQLEMEVYELDMELEETRAKRKLLKNLKF